MSRELITAADEECGQLPVTNLVCEQVDLTRMAAGGVFDEPLETCMYVVNAVVPPRQDQMTVLQPLDGPLQVRVRVRPFVDLSEDASRLVS